MPLLYVPASARDPFPHCRCFRSVRLLLPVPVPVASHVEQNGRMMSSERIQSALQIIMSISCNIYLLLVGRPPDSAAAEASRGGEPLPVGRSVPSPNTLLNHSSTCPCSSPSLWTRTNLSGIPLFFPFLVVTGVGVPLWNISNTKQWKKKT